MLKPIAIFAALMLALACPATAEEAAPAIAAAADDIPQAVKDACKDDYEKHCSKHEGGSPAARECMAGVFEKLSDGCVSAILDSPLAEEAAQQVAAQQAAAQKKDDVQAAASSDDTAASQSPKARTPTHHHLTGVAALNHHARLANAKPATRAVHTKHAKVATRIANAAPGKPAKHLASAERKSAHHAGASKRSVAGYIKHGTGIANYYVAKYTRFAFAKAFR